MSSLFARRDVIVVASVSCIYGIGSREDYEAMLIHLHAGQSFTREQLLEKLIALQYNRNDIAFERGQFRVRGDTIELCPLTPRTDCASSFSATRWNASPGFEPLTGNKIAQLEHVTVFPGKQFVTTNEKLRSAIFTIREELGLRIAEFEKQGKLLEASASRCARNTTSK